LLERIDAVAHCARRQIQFLRSALESAAASSCFEET